MTTNTARSVIGKPKENRFKVGADRVTTPIAMLIKVMTDTIGSIIFAENSNISPMAVLLIESSPAMSKGAPIGKFS